MYHKTQRPFSEKGWKEHFLKFSQFNSQKVGVFPKWGTNQCKNPTPKFKIFKHIQIQHKRGTPNFTLTSKNVSKDQNQFINHAVQRTKRKMKNHTEKERAYKMEELRSNAEDYKIGEHGWIRFLFNKKEKTLHEKSLINRRDVCCYCNGDADSLRPPHFTFS